MTLICPLPLAELSTVEASCQSHSVTTGEREGTHRRSGLLAVGLSPHSRWEWHAGGRPGEPAGLITGICALTVIQR